MDLITFVTALYVTADDFCKTEIEADPHRPGPAASLTRSEVVTLAGLAQYYSFHSERDAYRYIKRHLQSAFPALPDRSQFNRLMRRHVGAIQEFGLYLARCADAQRAPYESMDCMAMVTRNHKRRGRGWLPDTAAIGYSNRVGWFEGFKLLTSVTPDGLITGYGFASGNVNDRPIAEVFLAARCHPHPQLPTVGRPADGPYIVDKGFDGRALRAHWSAAYGVAIIGVPQHPATAATWPKAVRRQIAHWRQIVETVNERLLNWWHLDSYRPHSMDGLQARLAAKVAFHNFIFWLNRQLGRPPLAVAGLIDY